LAYYADLRDYLNCLEAAGWLRRISRTINKDTELHPLVRWQFRGLEQDQRTGWLFENLTGLSGRRYPSRVATSILAPNRAVYALGLKCSPGEIAQRWVDAYRKPIPAEVTSSGPCKEVVHVGDALLEHGGLDEFAIPVATNGWEALPRLTAVCWHSQDPETGVINSGIYNSLQTGATRTNVRCGPHTGMLVHWRKCKQRGIPLQAAAVIGPLPSVVMASGARIPGHLSEHEVAGGLVGEPLPVVRCETMDLLVPASAEIVIEGEIPTDTWEMDGASGEHTGYTILNRWVWPFHVKAITHRQNPIWQDIISQMPPSESSTLKGIASEGRMTSFLRQSCSLPAVKDVAFHDAGSAYRLCVIRIQDLNGHRTPAATVWRALHATMSIGEDWPKITIAVDEDIDPTDLESVMWAVCFRWQPSRDTRMVEGRRGGLDLSARPAPGSIPEDLARVLDLPGVMGASAMLIDATRKWDYPPVSLPKQGYMENARAIWEELGLPRLTPRTPWYGYDLGHWPEEYQRQAEMAERGDFDAAVQDLISRQRPDTSQAGAVMDDE
jgi:4-hydroxy-3-polyprenylbenzoate decarboxylase